MLHLLYIHTEQSLLTKPIQSFTLNMNLNLSNLKTSMQELYLSTIMFITYLDIQGLLEPLHVLLFLEKFLSFQFSKPEKHNTSIIKSHICLRS